MLEDVVNASINGILLGSVYSLIAMGLALIWGVMDVINFAQGDYMMLGAFITYFLFIGLGIDPLLSIPLTFVVVFLTGILTQRFVIDRILEAPLISQIAATFSILLIIRFGAEALIGPYTFRLVTGYADYVIRLGFIILHYTKLLAFIISILTVISLYIFLTRTFLGTAIRATSQNRIAAQLVGVNIGRMYKLAFGIGVGISAIGGALLSTFYPLHPEMGGFFCLLAFVIVVFGGFGSIFGAFFSGIIIGVVQMLSALFVPPTLKDAIAFIIFILVLLFRPTGIFGKGV